jgi:type IV pilus assembly protein PilM
MLFGFVQNWIGPRANPIGVDFGTDCLRLAQVQQTPSGEYKLLAAASADVPGHVRRDPNLRLGFFAETTRELLATGQFKGRDAVLALPAASMFIQHLRVAKMGEQDTRKAIPWESRGKLPIDPSQALIRHLIAGEVYQDQEPKNEVIVMAAAREFVNQLLAAAAKAKLNVVGMNVEPKAIVDCFSHVYRRKTDHDVTSCFIDIGCCATRAMIARGQQILFARSIPFGGDHFTRAAAQALGQGFEETKLLRIKLSATAPALDDPREKTDVPAPADASARAPESKTPSEAELAQRIDHACHDTLGKLVSELDLCRRYYEATFAKPGATGVERLIFIGGEARQRWLCQQIARGLSIAAQLGDPLVRMGRISDIGIESGIDRRHPQPGWAVAIGLSLGPSAPQPAGAAAEQTTIGNRQSAMATV